jgi:hypothetical protein
MKFIEVSEYGSNIIKSIVIDKIKTLETIKYNNGDYATIIYFIDSTELHVNNKLIDLKELLT